MMWNLCAVLLVLCSVNLCVAQYDWENFIDACLFREMFMTQEYGLNAHISNKNLSVYEVNNNRLGLFTCLVFKNLDKQYKTLELELSDEAFKRKIESNACRAYPLRTDKTEKFDISIKQEVRVITYRPFGSQFPMQTINSIKIDGVEQINKPGQEQLNEANAVIQACLTQSKSPYNTNLVDCEFEGEFKFFKIRFNGKLAWCYIQTESTSKQIDFDISNNNYLIYETYPKLNVINKVRNNYIIVNAKNNEIYDLPRVLAVHQADPNESPPAISFVRVNSKQKCMTPLVETTINCGRPQVEYQPFDSIVHPNQYPWIVFVYTKQSDSQFTLACQGTLLDQNTVITAATCVLKEPQQTYALGHIRVLLKKFEKADTPQQSNDYIKVSSVVVSPQYNKEYKEYNLAILKLKKSVVSFENHTIPICTTNNGALFADKEGIVTGFGLDRISRPLNNLSQAQMVRLKPDVCRRREGYFRMYLNENTYCAEYANSTSICPEMIGSGMFVKVNDVWVLTGIVTIGIATEKRCSVTAISLYSDIAATHEFIETNRNKQ